MEKKLKMKDITENTGINKSTVLYYLSLGLFPQPVKTSKNTALYPASYLDIIPVIRHLKESMHLPLGVIKQLIDGIGFENFSIEYASHYYETFLNPHKHGGETVYYSGSEFQNHSNLKSDEIDELASRGLLFSSGNGSYYSDDLFAAMAYKKLKDLGIAFSDIERLTSSIKELASGVHELYHEKAKDLNRTAEQEFTGGIRKEFEIIFDYLINKYFLMIYTEENSTVGGFHGKKDLS